jgi:hypothetical protein
LSSGNKATPEQIRFRLNPKYPTIPHMILSKINQQRVFEQERVAFEGRNIMILTIYL